MNIFVTSSDPVKCAKYLDNKRLVKMVLESAQLLSTAMTVSGIAGPYKVTHINHPCSVWARESKDNYNWLLAHFVALCNEYTNRYSRIHKCESLLGQFKSYLGNYTASAPKYFANCSMFKDESDVFKAYQDTMEHKWAADMEKYIKE
jgi:hypothetical protein